MAIDIGHCNFRYLAPTDLEVTTTPIKKVLVIGSCVGATMADIVGREDPDASADYIQLNFFGDMPNHPPSPVESYDFQIIQILSRFIFNENEYFSLEYDDVEGYNAMFDRSLAWLASFLDVALKWNVSHKLLTFIPNFLVPQQNALGRLLPRYDLRNPVYFFERLNFGLHKEVERFKNVHIIEFDQIVSSFGRRFSRDDGVWIQSHGAFLTDWDEPHEKERIERPLPMREYYRQEGYDSMLAHWHEVKAAYRTLRQIDSVKLVVIDLDDTLWRGVVAEGVDSIGTLEGWPLGFIEALVFLKKRGVLLAIISKNTEEVVVQAWDRIISKLIRLEDFVVRKINWQSKTENMEAVLAETNLLAKSVVFIDDNPVEREHMKLAFPEMRVLGRHPYYLKRILLWSPEIQVPFITNESGRRTEMVQQQVKREESRRKMSREEFLNDLNLSINLFYIHDPKDVKLKRILELINKTNQFNSNGRRWSAKEIDDFLENSGEIIAFDVSDNFSAYGLVGALIIHENIIEQFVMSCRVMGLEVEAAALAHTISHIQAAGYPTILARIAETKSNFVFRDVIMRNGFEPHGSLWVYVGSETPRAPAHIASAAIE